MKCFNCGREPIPDNSQFCPGCGKPTLPSVGASDDVVAVDFFDFQIRLGAEYDDTIQVIVHSSPVGDMRRPLMLQLQPVADNRSPLRLQVPKLRALHHMAEDGWSEAEKSQGLMTRSMVELGKQLAKLVLPDPVFSLLNDSLNVIGPNEGLRLRLCLDESLVDLPWELLYRPDAPDKESLAGFLVLDPRISVVREAPTASRKLQLSQGLQRMVFAGTLSQKGKVKDPFKVQQEYTSIVEALQPISDYLQLDDFQSAHDDHIESALRKTTSVFHYCGHTDVENVRGNGENKKGYLLKYYLGSGAQALYSEQLGRMLQQAETRLAAFSAQNSGRWSFVKPLLRAGLPALIGVHGEVMVDGSKAFFEKLYSSLAIGLSLDESVARARLVLLEDGVSSMPCEWAAFTVFMPSPKAVLLPQPESPVVRELQQAMRNEHARTINIVMQNIEHVHSGNVVGVLNGGS